MAHAYRVFSARPQGTADMAGDHKILGHVFAKLKQPDKHEMASAKRETYDHEEDS